jgi:hypothetical protein
VTVDDEDAQVRHSIQIRGTRVVPPGCLGTFAWWCPHHVAVEPLPANAVTRWCWPGA